MTTINDALANFKAVQENAPNLFDPARALREAQFAWMQAVTDAIDTGTGAVNIRSTEAGGVKVEHVDLTAAASIVDAAPSSTEPPVIPPSTPAV